jgi:hypothetical protein
MLSNGWALFWAARSQGPAVLLSIRAPESRHQYRIGISQFWINCCTDGNQTTTQHAAVGKIGWNASSRNRVSFLGTDTVLSMTNVKLERLRRSTRSRRATPAGLYNVSGSVTTTISSNAFNEARFYYGINKPVIACNLAGAGGSELPKKGSATTGVFATVSYPGAVFAHHVHGSGGRRQLTFTDNFSIIKDITGSKPDSRCSGDLLYMDVETLKSTMDVRAERLEIQHQRSEYLPNQLQRDFRRSSRKRIPLNPASLSRTVGRSSDSNANIGRDNDIDYTITEGNQFIDGYNANIIKKSGGGPILQKIQPDYLDACRAPDWYGANCRQADHVPWWLRTVLHAESLQLQRHLRSRNTGHYSTLLHVQLRQPDTESLLHPANPATGRNCVLSWHRITLRLNIGFLSDDRQLRWRN